MEPKPHKRLAEMASSRIDTTKTEDMVPSAELRRWLVDYLDLFEQLEALREALLRAQPYVIYAADELPGQRETEEDKALIAVVLARTSNPASEPKEGA